MGQDRAYKLTGAALKRLAVISMLIDHIGAVLLSPGALYVVCRLAGRLAFPLFCFLLVEGFHHTRDVRRYGRDLLFFALISELPFDLACHGTWFSTQNQNVFFTLFLGLCMLVCIQRVPAGGQKLAALWPILFFCAAAWVLRCDYQAFGIVLIALLYSYRKGDLGLSAPALWAAMLSLGYAGAAALAMVPISLYQGERGLQLNKYVYYWFYPAHLLLLALLSQLI